MAQRRTTSPSRMKRREEPVSPITDPVQAAKAAGLLYMTDSAPGIQRKRSGRGFHYIDPEGHPIHDPGVRERIERLAIPPAWTDVWISPNPRGHIQATGRDARGRKVYRYHDLWRCFRDATKYSRMVEFGEALPAIRQRIDADLARHGLSREKVLAAVVRLLDETRMRVGNEEYARENKSYGLTTLRGKHVDVAGSRLRFQFRGKSGKNHVVEVRDRRLARLIKRLQDLPGQHLFEYLDDDGVPHPVASEDVNEYLREVSGQHFTAKDFRTWSGTVMAASTLKDVGEYASETEAKRNVTHAIKQVAQQLGNTPAVCRKAYVHPGVIDSYLSREWPFHDSMRDLSAQGSDGDELSPEEGEVLLLLKHLQDVAQQPRRAG